MLAQSVANIELDCTDRIALSRASDLFMSLSNPIRLAIILRVMKREWSVNEMAFDIALSQSALSQHLGKLRAAGVVTTRKAGQTVYYRCESLTIARLLEQVNSFPSTD
jgi:ArsR family transcriptional regulator, virulence genes transcriptional regulator